MAALSWVGMTGLTASAQTAAAQGAGQAPAAAQAKAPAAEAPKQDLTNWWLNSSLFYHPVPTRVLAHFEGTASYADSQGNVDGSNMDLKGEFDLRKHRLTNRVTAEHVRRDQGYGQTGGKAETTQTTLSNRLDYDLTKNFVLVGGIENYHDTVLLIDRRTSVFGGFGAASKLGERNQTNLTAGLAFSQFRFEEAVLGPAIARSGERVDTIAPSSGAMLLMQTWRCMVTKTVMLTEQGVFIDYFNADLGRRWSGGLDLNVPIAKHVSIAAGYQIKSEINRYTKILGVRPIDRALTTGIRVVL